MYLHLRNPQARFPHNMQNFIPATMTPELSTKSLFYSEESLRQAWHTSDARDRHIALLRSEGFSPEEATKEAEANFGYWMYRIGERGVTPAIDIEVFERYYDENVFRNSTTNKKEEDYELTIREPGGMLVKKGPDGDYLLQETDSGQYPSLQINQDMK